MFAKILIANRGAFALASAAVIVLAGCTSGPRYEESMQFAQTVTLATPTGPITAKSTLFFGESGVRGASWCTPLCDPADSRYTQANGEATVIDLGEKGVLLALLASPQSGDYPDAVFRRFQSGDDLASSGQEGLTAPVRKRGPDLGVAFGEPPSKPYIGVPVPFLVWFKDRNDPKSATPVDPDNLAQSLGQGFRLDSIMIERVTQIPSGQSSKVAAKLPWTTRDLRKPTDVAQAERDFRFMSAIGNDESYRSTYYSRPNSLSDSRPHY